MLAAAGKKRRSPPGCKVFEACVRARKSGGQNGKRIDVSPSGPPAQAAADSAPERMAPRYAPQQAGNAPPMWHHNEGKGSRGNGFGRQTGRASVPPLGMTRAKQKRHKRQKRIEPGRKKEMSQVVRGKYLKCMTRYRPAAASPPRVCIICY